MDLFISRLKSYITEIIQFLETYPLITIILAGVILFFKIFSMSEKQSSAGSWGIIIICVFMIMWGLGCLTGLGFGMSF
jgi:hypothetical protein